MKLNEGTQVGEHPRFGTGNEFNTLVVQSGARSINKKLIKFGWERVGFEISRK